MRARAADHFLAVLDEAVELGGERRDLGGEIAFEAPRLAVADARQRLAHAAQRTQADAHLQEHGEDQPGAQDRERPDQRAVEIARLVVDLVEVARDHEGVGARVVLLRRGRDGKDDALGEHAQLLVLRPIGITEDRLAGVFRVVDPDVMIEQRMGDLHVGSPDSIGMISQ